MTGRHRAPTPHNPAPAVAAVTLTAGWLALTTTGPLDGAATFNAGTQPAPPPVPAAAPQARTVAVAAALTKLGTPYLWGAKGPNRFDCSGLTQWAWRQAGIPLGEDTYHQFREGQPAANVEPGDLIFPLRSFTRRGPGHVQLAVDPTHVIEAPGAGMKVRIIAIPADFEARRP